MEVLLGIALLCICFATLGLGVAIWLTVIKDWKDRDN